MTNKFKDRLGELIDTALQPDDLDPLLDSDGNAALIIPKDDDLSDYTEEDDAYEALLEDLSPGEAEEVVEKMRPLSKDERKILDETPGLKGLKRIDDAEQEDFIIARSREGYRGMDSVLEDAVYGDDMNNEEKLERNDSDSGWSVKKLGRRIGRGVSKRFVPGRDAAKAKIVRNLHQKMWEGHANWLALQDKQSGRPLKGKAQYESVAKRWSKQKIGRKGLPLQFAVNGEMGNDMMGSWYNPFTWFTKKSKEVLDESQSELSMEDPYGDPSMGPSMPEEMDPSMDPQAQMPYEQESYEPPYESEGDDMTTGISGDDSLGAFATEILSGANKTSGPNPDQLVEIAVVKLRSGRGLTAGEVGVLSKLAASGHPRAKRVFSVIKNEGKVDSSGAWLHKLNPLRYVLKSSEERKFEDIERDSWKKNADLQKDLGKRKVVLDQAERAKQAREAVAQAQAQAAATEEQLKAISASLSGELIRDLNADVNGSFVGHENPTAITKVVISALDKVGKKKTAQGLYAKIAKGESLTPAELTEARQIARLLNKVKVVHGDLIDDENDPAVAMHGAFVGACLLGNIDKALAKNAHCQKTAAVLSKRLAAGKPMTDLERKATVQVLKNTDKLRTFTKAHVTGAAFVGLDNAKSLKRSAFIGATKVMSPAEKKMLSSLVKMAKSGNPRAIAALAALKKSGEIMGGDFVGMSLSSAFNYAMKPITVPAKYLYKGTKWTGQKMGIISKGTTPEQVRLAKMRAAAKRRAAAKAKARAADASSEAELRAQQSIADAADAEADAADAEALAKEAAMRTKEIEADPSQAADAELRAQQSIADAADADAEDSSGEFIGSWSAFVGEGVEDSSGGSFVGASPKSKKQKEKEKAIIAKANEKSATGIKIRAGAAVYKKAKAGDKKSRAAIKTMVVKAKKGDLQAKRDLNAIKAGRMALATKKKAQKREAVALARKARKAKVVAVQKKFEAMAANKLARMERKRNLKKLSIVERKAAAGNPKARAYVAKQVAASKKGDKKAANRVAGMKLARDVRKAAPNARERRNQIAAQKLMARVLKGDPKAIRQLRVLEASAKAGNPNAKRAMERLALAKVVIAAIAVGTITRKGKKDKKGLSKADHAQNVARAKEKNASREELAAGARSAQALGDRKTAGDLAVKASDATSATETLKKTSTVVAAKEAGNERAKEAIVSSFEAAKSGSPAGIQKTANVVAVQTIDDVNKGKELSPTMKDALNLNERIKAKDPIAIDEAKRIREAATGENPFAEATMAAVALSSAVAIDKALAAKPKAKAELMNKVNPPLTGEAKTEAEAKVNDLVAKANAGTITPEEGLAGIRLAEKLGRHKVAAEIAAKSPPMSYDTPLSSLPDMPLAPITGVLDLMKETVKALTFSTRDPLANYRGGLAARAKVAPTIEPVSSSGWSPFGFFKKYADFITPLAASTAAVSSLTTLLSKKGGNKAPAAPVAPVAPVAPAPVAVVEKKAEPTTSEGDDGKDQVAFKNLIAQAIREKAISKRNLAKAIDAHLGNKASTTAKKATAEQVLNFLKGKNVTVSS